jgi:hypothetical protein
MPRRAPRSVEHVRPYLWSSRIDPWAFALPIAIMLALAVLASLPLWYAKTVLFPKKEADRRRYGSRWVTATYLLLCVVAAFVILMIMCAFRLHLRACLSEDPSGYGISSYVMIIPVGLMFWVMLPLSVVYRAQVVE